jgi:hypothetical protein
MDQVADAVVQRLAARGAGEATLDDGAVRSTAAAGFAGPAVAVPHLDVVQRSFGRHDVSGVEAHVGGAAAEASAGLGARAYASGSQVAFAESPDLFLAAHELAHVVQQRGAVQLASALGAAGDQHEQHADAVAAAVVRGESAEPLLDQYAGGGGAAVVQRDPRGAGDVGAIAGLPLGAEGHVRVHRFQIAPGAPLGPYVELLGASLDGMVDYRVGPATTEGGASPHREVHAGVGGARGHGHGSLGIQGEIVQHLEDTLGGGTADLAIGGDLSPREASLGIGINGGAVRLGNGFELPLPNVQVNLVQWERAQPGEPPSGVRFLVGVLTVPLPQLHLSFAVGDRIVELTPHLDVVVEIAPNQAAFMAAIRRLAQGGAQAAEGAAAEGAAAEGATAAEGAAAGETAAAGEAAAAGESAVAAEGAAATAAGTGAAATDAAIAAEAATFSGAGMGATALVGGLAAGFAMAELTVAAIALDLADVEDVRARARGAAHALFDYAMTYALEWLEPGSSPLRSAAARRGVAAAAGDIAAFRAAHPGEDPRRHARVIGASNIYSDLVDALRSRAEEAVRARTATRPGSMDDVIIIDQIDQIRWNGPLFRQFGS